MDEREPSQSKKEEHDDIESDANPEVEYEGATQDTITKIFSAIQIKLKNVTEAVPDQLRWTFNVKNDQGEAVELSLRKRWDDEEDKIAFLTRRNLANDEMKHYSVFLGERGKLRLEGFEPRLVLDDVAHTEEWTVNDYLKAYQKKAREGQQMERSLGYSDVTEEEADELARMIVSSNQL